MKFRKKIYFIAASFVLLSSASFAQKKTAPQKKWVTVSGKIAFLQPDQYRHFNKVWIGKGNGYDYKAIDSVDVKPDGTYSIRVDATIPSIYRIDLLKENRVEFFADADAVINDRGYDTAKIKIKNPPYVFIESRSLNNRIINMINHIGYRGYQEMISVYNEDYMAKQHKKTDSAWAHYLVEKDRMGKYYEGERERMQVLVKNFIDQPAVILALGATNWKKNPDEAYGILDNLVKKYPWFAEAKKMKEDINTFIVRSKMLENGKPAPLFSYADPKGAKVSLASYKGKYVLIDFWASWCGPCRSAIPKVKELYEKYKDKGFDVLSVSIDQDRQAWLKAVKEESMPWAQVLSEDIRKTQTDYMFSGIPTLYLIDDKGNIAEKFTGFSEEAEAKLHQVLDKI